MKTMRIRRNEQGVAFIMALVVVLVLAAITLAMGFMTTSEVDIHRLSRWDTLAQYLGQAGIEHQIYLLKSNKNDCGVPYQEFPQLAQYSPGLGPFWYFATPICSATPGDPCTPDVNGCPTGNPDIRRWDINSYGEVWRYDAGTGTWALLQRRTIRARVEITYATCTAGTYACPSAVTLLRWERAEP